MNDIYPTGDWLQNKSITTNKYSLLPKIYDTIIFFDVS